MWHNRHNWDLIDKTLIESPLTKVINAKQKLTFEGYNEEAYCNDRLILVFKCDCGKVKVVEK